jgi:hypothetical protein
LSLGLSSAPVRASAKVFFLGRVWVQALLHAKR